MTTLMNASFKRRLKFVEEEVAEEVAKPVCEWSQETAGWCLNIVQTTSHKVVEWNDELNELLAKGVEAREFSRSFVNPLLPIADELLATIRETLAKLFSREDASSKSLTSQTALPGREDTGLPRPARRGIVQSIGVAASNRWDSRSCG